MVEIDSTPSKSPRHQKFQKMTLETWILENINQIDSNLCRKKTPFNILKYPKSTKNQDYASLTTIICVFKNQSKISTVLCEKRGRKMNLKKIQNF